MKKAVKFSLTRAISGLLPVLLLCCFLPVQAIEVHGLYRATIQVNSRDDAQERRRAFSVALQEVLAKISGSSASTNPASIRRALSNPEPYVESWSTQTTVVSTESNGISSQQQLIEIVVNFYESEIDRLLDENSISVWPANRPETLIWVVLEEDLAERLMLGSSDLNSSPVLAGIKNIADRRGLPLLFPLLDLEDQLSLNINRLWELDERAILSASRRYQAESVLAIRLYKAISGEMQAKSLYFFRGNVFTFEQSELNETDFLGASINLASNELSQYYAVLLSGTDSSVLVNLQVDGIDSPTDYSALLSYLNTLEGINSFQLKEVTASSLYLQLNTGGQLRQLVETMALESSLQSATEFSRQGEEVFMHYRWVRD
jgi:hypothetical protein